MRFSQQFHRYQNEFGAEPPYPKQGTIQCFWFRRKMGRVAEKVDIVLTPDACRKYRIWAPQSLHPERAERIASWMAQQEAEAVARGAAERWHKRARREAE